MPIDLYVTIDLNVPIDLHVPIDNNIIYIASVLYNNIVKNKITSFITQETEWMAD